MTAVDDELLLKRPAETFTLPVMFTCTIATLVGNISRSHEELTGILGPMVAAGRGGVRALNSNFGHYYQAGYERFLKRPKPPPRRRERKRQGDASCFNSALEVTIIPGLDDNPPPPPTLHRRSRPQYYAVKCFPSTGYTQVPGHLPRSVRRFLCRGYLGPFSD